MAQGALAEHFIIASDFRGHLEQPAASARWVSYPTQSQVRGRANASQALHEYILQWPVNIHLSGIVFQLFVLCPVHLSLSRTIESNASEKNKASVYYLEIMFSGFGPR